MVSPLVLRLWESEREEKKMTKDLQTSCYAPRWFFRQCPRWTWPHRHHDYGTRAHYLQGEGERNRDFQILLNVSRNILFKTLQTYQEMTLATMHTNIHCHVSRWSLKFFQKKRQNRSWDKRQKCLYDSVSSNSFCGSDKQADTHCPFTFGTEESAN